MSFNANYVNLRSSQSFALFFHGSSDPLRPREFRVYRRRRLKRTRRLLAPSPRSSLPPFGDLFASAWSPEILAPLIGLASGLAAWRGFGRRASEAARDVGEWVLFASPTPFNRFVLLRCPSVAFEGRELLEGVSERLVKEDRHFVRLCSGRVLVREGLGGVIGGLERKLEYQRVCVSTDDGGVVSLDWPANLDLAEEHGFDTTLLVVPGSAQGSMEADIRAFVCEALRRGCFPVVMNPRGCAGSPLTTARLFTAADSDDICTAIQFINRERPWTTLMGVGWGYGANMLTKYLAEIGEVTPLTAVVCIDNPFDLEEATRSYPHHMGIDQKLTGGLVDILRSNKELFQGRAKGFDVEKALSATSVRDFEQAISMVSYGFEAVEDFYSKSSTRNLIGDVKIPVLFIQNHDGSAPLFSIPRSSIAENPFTSLLLCSCDPSIGLYRSRSAVTWCQQLIIEWLTAVELGLLKGRHPLLEEVDITINPSKGLAFMEGTSSNNTTKITKLLDLSPSRGHTTNRVNDMLEESETPATLILRSRNESSQKYKFENKGLQKVENGGLEQIMPADKEFSEQETEGTAEIESGEAVQTAQVVMNILDVTMPGTLTEEKKNKVLTAVGQGETVMNALQDAVPGDVREKLTTAVSGILRSQSTKLKIQELLRAYRTPSVSPESMSKMEEKVRETSNPEGLLQDHPSSEQTKKADHLLDGSVSNQPAVDIPHGGMEAMHLQSESSQNCLSTSEGNNNNGSVRTETRDSRNYDISDDITTDGKVLQNSENRLETGIKANSSSQAEKVGIVEEANVEEHMDQAGKTALSDMKEDNSAKNEEKLLPDQSKMTGPGEVAESPSPSGFSSEGQSMEKENSDNQRKEIKNTDLVMEQIKSDPGANSHSFSVSQALDALTGMDDSTQVAVNSVFSVIEDMITQLEEGSPDESGAEDEKNDSVSAPAKTATDDQSPKNSEATIQLGRSGGSNFIHLENERDSQWDSPTGFIEKESTQTPISLDGSDMKTFPERDTNTNEVKDSNTKKNQLASSNLLLENSSSIKKLVDTSAFVTSNMFSNSFNNDYLNNTLFSEIPTESLDSDATTALLLEYFPEEGQWKLLEQSGNNGIPDNDVGTKPQGRSPAKEDSGDDVIEPLYTILDTGKQQEPIEEFETRDKLNEKFEIRDIVSQEFMQFVQRIILDELMIEVSRKLGLVEFKELDPNLAIDLEQFSILVSRSIGNDVRIALGDGKYEDINIILEKVDTLNGERVIKAISFSVQQTTYLRRVLPVGVVVGSSLAALRKFFIVATAHGDDDDALNFDVPKTFGEKNHKVNVAAPYKIMSPKSLQNRKSEGLVKIKTEKNEPTSNKSATVMVGAVTAALGASALLAQHQQTDGILGSSSKSSKLKADNQNELVKLEEALPERNNHNIVTSLAERAMSVAGPVVPTTEDGEVDQERLVAMLADLGQKGGSLRLVGKVALLWGGLRGAMSLNDKLISFLRIAERPLIQRALGFSFMVLVLWSPVAVPLLPTLVQSWTKKNPARMAELACIASLYTAVTILVMLWGKRIRGYENPPEQYGLDLTSLPKIYNYMMGLIGGIVLVLSIQAVNGLLGFLSMSWPYTTTLDAISSLKVYCQMVMLVGQGLVTATGVALVEELLFRSWLPEEITADLGYHQGIIISGLVFSLLQRSPWAIPGLWLLSLCLSGIRQRSQGSLSVIIGLRAGILASSFILQRGGFLTYKPNFQLWLTGIHPFQPFSGITGFAFSLVLALVLYPRQPLRTKTTWNKIQE